MWEFLAATDGWLAANGADGSAHPSPEEHDELVEKYRHLE